MSLRRLQFDAFHLVAGDEWEDITATLQDKNAPFTIAKAEGVGALQFSPAIYRSGPTPSPSLEDLRSMAVEFAERHDLGEPFDCTSFSDELIGVGASYHSEDDFARIWYLSNGRNIMFVTYICAWSNRFDESAETETIVKSMRLIGTGWSERAGRKL